MLTEDPDNAPLRSVTGTSTSTRAAAAAAFLAVCDLGLRAGGYEPTVVGELSIVIWGALAFVFLEFRPAEFSRPAIAAILAIAAFGLWTGISLFWTESIEQGVYDLGRAVFYAGSLILALVAVRTGAARAVLYGVAAAAGVVLMAAALSRLLPALVPTPTEMRTLSESRAQLSYPIGYWNALAAFAAMAIPLQIGLAAATRNALARGALVCLTPVAVLVIYLTASRGGAIAAVCAVAAMLVFAPTFRFVGLSVAAIVPGVVLAVYSSRFPAVLDGLIDEPTARSDGLTVALVLLAAIVASAVGGAIAMRNGDGLSNHEARTLHRRASLIVAALVALALVATPSCGCVDDAVDRFKTTTPETQQAKQVSPTDQLTSISGRGRYELWSTAISAWKASPLSGAGAGSFGLIWNRSAQTGPIARNAHSHYLETLAELGLVGAIVFGALVLSLLSAMVLCSRRIVTPERYAVAACVGTSVAFGLAAAVDWVWEIPAIALIASVAAAVLLQGPGVESRSLAPSARRSPSIARVAKVGIASVAVLVTLAIGTLTLGERELSQANTDGGRSNVEAMRHAERAREILPWSAEARLRQALLSPPADGLRYANQALRMEPTNWRPWFTRASLHASVHQDAAALRDFDQAMKLNRHAGEIVPLRPRH